MFLFPIPYCLVKHTGLKIIESTCNNHANLKDMKLYINLSVSIVEEEIWFNKVKMVIF